MSFDILNKCLQLTLVLFFTGFKELKKLPSVSHRHNSSSVLSNAQEDRLSKIKVVQGRVAPASCIVGQGVVWWAEVGGSDHDGARQAPPVVIRTPNLIA